MNDSDKIILVVLGQAIKSEQEGNDYYDDLAAKADDPIGKEMFERLALEEKNHEKEMMEKYDEIAERCGWEPYEGSGTMKFLEHLDVELPFLDEDHASFVGNASLSGNEVLTLAIEVEKASADFFMNAAVAVDQTDAKEFFVDLAKSEITHAHILEREMQRLASRG